MNTNSMKILGVGTVTIDHVMEVPRYPQADSKNEALSARFQVGGPVPIALAQLSRFGHQTHFLGAWGDDPFGDLVEKRLRSEGMGFFPDSCREIETSVTQVWLEKGTGQRTLVTSRSDASHLLGKLSVELMSEFDVLHLDCWPSDAALKAAELMKEKGGLVCVDTGSPKPGVEEILRLADVVNCPKRFCQRLLGEHDLCKGAQRVAEFGPELVTVTDGESGAVICSQGETLHRPAIKNKQIVDTNGAGDSFSGAVIHGAVQKWAPDRVLNFAVVCAGLKCTQTGNEAALPSEADILECMQQSE